LLDERQQQMLGLNLGVVSLLGVVLGGDDGFLGLFGEFVEIHRF
jgi:hypothetical protein